MKEKIVLEVISTACKKRKSQNSSYLGQKKRYEYKDFTTDWEQIAEDRNYSTVVAHECFFLYGRKTCHEFGLIAIFSLVKTRCTRMKKKNDS
jgi:hypothetical protein